MGKQRICYFDFLRVLSVFFVIVIHVTSVGLQSFEIATDAWIVNSLLNSVSRWAVPIFFMVSGALFLAPTKEISAKKLCRKNVCRILICIIVWGLFYSLLDQYLYGSISVKSILIAVYGIITGNTGYHMWFLYTLVMLYIAVPLFRLITCHATKQQLKYALVVWWIFSLLVGQINAFAGEAGVSTDILPYSPFVITGYGGYFLLGYYLTAYPLKDKTKNASYALAVLSVCMIIGGKMLLLNSYKMESTALEMPLGILSCLIAVAIFSLAQHFRISDACSRVLCFWGQRTFGIYLTHVFFISLLYHIWNVTPDYCQPLLAVFASSVGVLVVSLIASWSLSKIPLLRKLV